MPLMTWSQDLLYFLLRQRLKLITIPSFISDLLVPRGGFQPHLRGLRRSSGSSISSTSSVESKVSRSSSSSSRSSWSSSRLSRSSWSSSRSSWSSRSSSVSSCFLLYQTSFLYRTFPLGGMADLIPTLEMFGNCLMAFVKNLSDPYV